MKLTYRGISYETNPAVAAPAAVKHAPVADLHYRGATYRRSQAAQNQALDALVMQRAAVNPSTPVVDLIYRGVTYRRQQAAPMVAMDAIVTTRNAADAAIAPGATASVQERARLLTLNRQRAANNRQRSMLNRSAAEVGADIAGYWGHA